MKKTQKPTVAKSVKKEIDDVDEREKEELLKEVEDKVNELERVRNEIDAERKVHVNKKDGAL